MGAPRTDWPDQAEARRDLMKPRDILRNTAHTGGNLLRSLRRKGLDYVVLPIRGPYPERTPQHDPLPFPFNRLSLLPREVSLEDMRSALEIIGGDSRVHGVVLRFHTSPARLSTLYSLRRMLLGLRVRGKRLIAWLPTASTGEYYLASACDEIVLPPCGRLLTLGLRAETMFLKDTLALAGVTADFESIAEYKVAPDLFRRSAMTEAHREMLNAILDSHFDEIVTAIAKGRGLDVARVRALIDDMPLTPAEAVEAGLADAVMYEDELAQTSFVRRTSFVRPHLSAADHAEGAQEDGGAGATLLTWQQASRWLRKPVQWTTRQRIGVVSLEGMIVPGQSRRVPAPVPLPVVEAQAGADTIVQALRRAETDSHIAALIFHVDTPGGSALASDLIWRAVRRLRERKPVVVLMGTQAASGGYYVSAPANRIVARPTTLTGSIGIWGGKLVLAGLYEKLGVGREAVQRGALAGLYSEVAPFSDKERARVRRDMGEGYARFKARVAEGRGMTEEQVEEIARGRVWTGAQAREIGLVDELGDFETALAIAKELAGLKAEREYTVVQVRPPRHEMQPSTFPMQRKATCQQDAGGPSLLPAAGLRALLETWHGLARERVWALAPWSVQVRG
jgi:protease-4